MTDLCNIDGRIKSEAQASVPILDRGFLFGDSIYEVIRTHKGKLLCPAEHLERLRASADRIELAIPLSDEALTARIEDTLQAAGNTESYVRIIITRGTGMRPDIDPDYTLTAPTVIVWVRDLPASPATALTDGISARLVQTRRNDRRALDPAIKSGNYLNNILGLMEARRHGAETAIFLNPEGGLAEAPTANLWIVRGGEIATPRLSAGILPGITRALVLRIGARDDLAMVETALGEADLRAADEVFLTSTVRNVLPVTKLDEAPVGDGRPGPVTLDLSRRLLAFCDELVG